MKSMHVITILFVIMVESTLQSMDQTTPSHGQLDPLLKQVLDPNETDPIWLFWNNVGHSQETIKTQINCTISLDQTLYKNLFYNAGLAITMLNQCSTQDILLFLNSPSITRLHEKYIKMRRDLKLHFDKVRVQAYKTSNCVERLETTIETSDNERARLAADMCDFRSFAPSPALLVMERFTHVLFQPDSMLNPYTTVTRTTTTPSPRTITRSVQQIPPTQPAQESAREISKQILSQHFSCINRCNTILNNLDITSSLTEKTCVALNALQEIMGTYRTIHRTLTF